MLRVRVGELSLGDQERLRGEIAGLLLTTLTAPAFMDYRRGALRRRPWGRADRERALGFVAGMRFAELAEAELGSATLSAALRDLALGYQTAHLPARADQRRMALPGALAVPGRVTAVQRRLTAYVLAGAHPEFGALPIPDSWRSPPDMTTAWESVAAGTLALASALAQTRDEAPEGATQALPVVPPPARPVRAPSAPSPLPTAPLPRPVAPPEAAPAPGQDRAIFTQLRQQLLGAMRAAAAGYRLTHPPEDPAGLLAALRAADAIDDADLQLAENILALCGRVVTAGRASLDDYRQALTLYLLFHRGRLIR